MEGVRTAAPLTKVLLSKTGLELPRPYSALAAPAGRLNSSIHGNKENTGNATELPTQEKESCCVEVAESPISCSLAAGKPLQKLTGLLSSGQSIPWRYCVSASMQQARFMSGGPDKCAPKKMKVDTGPLPCVIMRRPPAPCFTPAQKKWLLPDKFMCLPCCEKVERPLRCKILIVRLNDCPRKTYRIAAYSECAKRYGRHTHIKECCYKRRICYEASLPEREILPLIPIRERQGEILGMNKKTPDEPWGS